MNFEAGLLARAKQIGPWRIEAELFGRPVIYTLSGFSQ